MAIDFGALDVYLLLGGEDVVIGGVDEEIDFGCPESAKSFGGRATKQNLRNVSLRVCCGVLLRFGVLQKVIPTA